MVQRSLTLLAKIEAVKQEKKIIQDKIALPRMTFRHQLNPRMKNITHEVRSLRPSGTCRRHRIVQSRCEQCSQPHDGSIEEGSPVPNPFRNRKLGVRHSVGKSRNMGKVVFASSAQIHYPTNSRAAGLNFGPMRIHHRVQYGVTIAHPLSYHTLIGRCWTFAMLGTCIRNGRNNLNRRPNSRSSPITSNNATFHQTESCSVVFATVSFQYFSAMSQKSADKGFPS